LPHDQQSCTVAAYALHWHNKGMTADDNPARKHRYGYLRRKWRAWRTYAADDRWLIVEAAFWLGVARFIVVFLPFRWIGPWLRQGGDAPAHSVLPDRVGKAVLVASRHVPWQALCLPQAMSAKQMLKRRGFHTVLHLGAKLQDDGRIAAHAWLICGDDVVTGGGGMTGYTPLVGLG
jgi:Transglutaminase-like superfamily